MFTFNSQGRLWTLSGPAVMGIINTTPDSFYGGSREEDVGKVLEKAGRMIAEGATILDIGGQSTRPQSTRLTAAEELDRVMPTIEALRSQFPGQLLSIDTFYAKVAEASVKAGVHIVNDVSAGSLDAELLPAVARLGVPYVLMHMQGTPQTMQARPTYQNVTLEVFDFLAQKLADLRRRGIHDVIVDPGFGFGKTAAHNFELLRHLSFFQELQRPLMTGLSRKATVYKTLGVSAEEALNGTTVLHTIALLNGASLLRVHDVKEAVEAVKLYQAYAKEKEQA